MGCDKAGVFCRVLMIDRCLFCSVIMEKSASLVLVDSLNPHIEVEKETKVEKFATYRCD
jgi:hypothetical protein